ncbi:ATP-binding protein [Streptomyces viridosporus]|uniref:ATP-binding protein n=1 Tax=Streptomyces viridosporus TaxID=67581 RepID=UPI0037021423
MTSPLLPGDRPTPRRLLPVPLLTLALSAPAVAAAVLLGPESARGAVGTTGVIAALLLCAAVTAATYAVLTARAARGRLESVTQDVGRLLQERARLAEDSRRQHERLTGELNRERARLSAELDRERNHLAETLAAERDRIAEQHALSTARLTQEHGEELTRLTDAHAAELKRLAEEHAEKLRLITEEHTAHTDRLTRDHAERIERLTEERDRLAQDRDRLTDGNARLAARLREATGARAAALSATANAAGRMQALATGMLADLRAMEEKHHDEEVLADLLHLDHRTAQAGRLADSVAVLTGARSGRRWARPIAMESILRGAMGRISGYQRVRVHSASDAAVAGHAAEGVMHALAELLDNAANFSPPTAEVHVYVEEVPAGVIVSVEDSGLVMGEAQLRRAERAVSGESAELGGLTGTRLGLAVVGRLARRYGLRVSYRPSARGGTGVLMLIPQEILAASAADATAPVPPPAAMPAVPATPAALTGTTASPASSSASSASSSAPSASSASSAPAARNRAAGSPAGTDLPRRDGRAQAARADAAGTEPETSHATAHETAPAERATTARDTTSPATGTASYAASRAGADLDPDPVPTHGSADTGEHPLVLPRRRRGRTLAEAERTRSGSRAAAPRPAPTAEETKARTARFSSFRQAVRATGPDGTDPTTTADATPGSGTGTTTPAGTAPDPTPEAQNTPATPEGDTTS